MQCPGTVAVHEKRAARADMSPGRQARWLDPDTGNNTGALPLLVSAAWLSEPCRVCHLTADIKDLKAETAGLSLRGRRQI